MEDKENETGVGEWTFFFSRQRRTWQCTQRFRPGDGAYSRTTWLSDTCPLKGDSVRSSAVIISSSCALPNVSCSGCGLVSYMSVVSGTWIWTSLSTVPLGSGGTESYHDSSARGFDLRTACNVSWPSDTSRSLIRQGGREMFAPILQ